MSADRYVLLGLARPRAAWFREVAQWATSAAIPAEFLKCVSAEELRARLATGRRYSGVLLDGSLPAVDRDLFEAARAAGCAVLVVDDGGTGRDWVALGAAAVLPTALAREALLDVLTTHAVLVGRTNTAVLEPELEDDGAFAARAPVAAVCGPGGTGASTMAAALAQGLAGSGRHGTVVLADLALNGEQAMLNDVRDVVPGVQELVEAHRSRQPSADEIRSLTFHILERRYHLLLGLRRARYWSTLRPRSFEAAFDALRRAFDVVVADTTADFEGEDDGGSADVEDRNRLARTAVHAADVVFVVGRPGVKGLHALVRVLADLAGAGVPAGRVVPVFNQAPRQPKARAELSAALAELAPPAMGGGQTMSPLFLPGRRVEEAVRDAVALPGPLPQTLSAAFDAVAARLGSAPPIASVAPEPVVPGSLGLAGSEEGA